MGQKTPISIDKKKCFDSMLARSYMQPQKQRQCYIYFDEGIDIDCKTRLFSCLAEEHDSITKSDGGHVTVKEKERKKEREGERVSERERDSDRESLRERK